MDYRRIYNDFIESRKDSEPAGYTELHHIIPRSLGGTDDPENLIRLSAREHYFAHCCLAMMHGGKMWQALHAVCVMPKVKSLYVQARMVHKARAEFAKVASSRMTDAWASGEFKRVRVYGPMPEETRKKISESNKGKKASPEAIKNYMASRQANAKRASFYHHESGASFEGTAKEFAEFSGVSDDMARLLISGRVSHASKWTIGSHVFRGRDTQVRKFFHKDGDEFVGTSYEFRKRYDLDSGVVSNMVRGKNKVQSFKGWRYAGPC